MRAQFVLSEIWIGLRRNLTMTIAVIVTVAISLALFGSGLLINRQVDQMRGFWEGRIQVTIYLCNEVSANPQCQENGPPTEEQRAQIQTDLEAMPQVESVTYESAEEAWQHFSERFESNPALVDAADPEDLPESFRVALHNPQDFNQVASAFEGAPGVDNVYDERQILNRFFDLLSGLQNAAFIVALVQIVAAALLIGNTIRLSAYSRRRETGIMRLVGASNFYIQLPFLLEGAIAGLIGGIVGSIFIVAAKFLLLDGMQDYFQFATTLPISELIYVILLSIVLGVLLCSLASFISLRRYLRV
ncbi:permease-like cell division protein FtsX [Allonocardiopsis opalescens]|uniref:Cell division protein FtsX n=1 Tax=Allonocardiopsis opalescens TaxID=1144618 RepID=A0A2T0QC66_9ACTN|nr:permease-like cell division protein FtsX [Allonocardiopsis opalescens]PRY01544.1 cell division protein FtsX [Allonocardiopsis opalescens]